MLFEATDSKAFNDATRRLVTDPSIRGSLGRGATATIHDRGFNWDANAHRVENLFTNLSKNKKGHK